MAPRDDEPVLASRRDCQSRLAPLCMLKSLQLMTALFVLAGTLVQAYQSGKQIRNAAHHNPGCSRGLNPPVSSSDLAM